VSTRSRTATAVLSLLLAAPVLLAGCGDGDAPEGPAAASSSTAERPAGAATESAAADTVTEEASEAPGDPDFPGDTAADTAEPSAGAAVTVTDIRVGAHGDFDRVVLEVGGTGTPGWDVRYVDAASSQGSGDPVEVAGDAVLQVTLTGVGYPYETGVEEFAGTAAGEGTTAVTEVVYDATFEGTAVSFVGTAGQRPFRVYALENPTRVVVEVASAG
jgi:hypothetical protein